MSDSGPAPTMSERVGDRWTRMKLYILLTLNRKLFTALLGGGMFLSLLALGTFAEPSFRSYLIQYDPSRYVFQAYITALVTGVTLVVTLSQLVLSQELGPLRSQRQRMELEDQQRQKSVSIATARPDQSVTLPMAGE